MSSEAFVLLNLPDVTLTTLRNREFGILALECVTTQADEVHHPEVYLVIRLNSFECPIDPTRPVYFLFDAQLGRRSYTLSSPDGSTLELLLPLATEPGLLEDQDTFHGVLAQYAEICDSTTGSQDLKAPAVAPPPIPSQQESSDHEAMRGRLVLIDETNGEIVGELDNRMNINEDPSLSVQGRETDPVVIELPEDDTRAALALAIPPEDQDWIIKSASFARYYIVF
jgi:spartin